jgi:hypothetical protein
MTKAISTNADINLFIPDLLRWKYKTAPSYRWRHFDQSTAVQASKGGFSPAHAMVDCTLPGYTTRFMIEQSSERPIEQTPENYRELQAMVFYADPLFIGRNGAWLSSQAVLLAIAVAQFKQVPAAMVLTLAVSGVLISVFWFFAAKSLADRITWLDSELCKFEGSIHAQYLSDRRSPVSRRWTFGIMTHALPTTLAVAWILLAIIKYGS